MSILMSNYSMCQYWTQKRAAQIRAAFALFIVRCAELLTDLINTRRGEAGDDAHGDRGYVVVRGGESGMIRIATPIRISIARIIYTFHTKKKQDPITGPAPSLYYSFLSAV